MSTEASENICLPIHFVGNRFENCLDLVGPDKRTLREKYLIGEPRACPLGSAEEMKRRGFVGIYLKPTPVRNIRVKRKVFICIHCEGIYADAPVTACDCMAGTGLADFYEGELIYMKAAPPTPTSDKKEQS